MSRPHITVTVGRDGQRSATVASPGMFLDQTGGVVGSRKRSVKDRLGGTSSNISSISHTDSKRQCQEASWKPSAYPNLQVADDQNCEHDLRHKLDQKNSITSRRSLSVSANMVKHLHEKISGPVQPPHGAQQLWRHPSSLMRDVPEIGRLPVLNPIAPRMNIAQEVPLMGHSNLASLLPWKGEGSSRKVTSSCPLFPPLNFVAEQLTVAALLQSLGLAKYLIMFQAEEIDMTALRHMDDDDLKELGIPMGPRKKILLALTSKRCIQ